MGRSRIVWVIGVVLVFFSSCRTKEKVSTVAILPRLTGKEIIRNLEDTDFDFASVFFKRVVINIEDDNQNLSFKANVFLIKDSSVVVSILPAMGIELYRVLLEPGGFKVLDRLNKEVTLSGYETLNSRFLVQLDFDLIQNILTNRLFNYPAESDKAIHNYDVGVDHSSYLLSSVNHRKLQRIYNHGTHELVLHQISIDPGIFRINGNKISDIGAGLNVNIDYSGFEEYGNKKAVFPQKIAVTGSKNDKSFKVSIKFGEVDFDGDSRISFKVPDKYETVYR